MYVVANPVNFKTAESVAKNYYQYYSKSKKFEIEYFKVEKFNGLNTFYTFIFKNSGFVIVSADDNVQPILAFSDNYFNPNDISPAQKALFESYNQIIEDIIVNNKTNITNKKTWENYYNSKFENSKKEVLPLLTTKWNQGNFYNALCPADPSGPGGRAWAGCVAAAISQIMKYHNFPAKGVGSHSYTHTKYGIQTANFGNTKYNWANMPNSLTSSNINVATLMYHAGVSIDMDYNPNGSGAFSDDVPYALSTYFNYSTTASIKSKIDYNDNDWMAMLKAELDASRPIYYTGSQHAFVCDGYDATDKFHINWGWSGNGDGFYALNSLGNSTIGYYNNNNRVIIGIKPANQNLICRITKPFKNQYFNPGQNIVIKADTITDSIVNLDRIEFFVDNNLKFTANTAPFNYTWDASAASLGVHNLKVIAISTTGDSSEHVMPININAWIPQATGFITESRGISGINIVNPSIVWAWAYNGSNPSSQIKEFTVTKNAGTTWTAKTLTASGITGTTWGIGNISAVDSLNAWAVLYNTNGSGGKIVKTNNMGQTWNVQSSAVFGIGSFPNVVHMFDLNNGWCMGDPVNNTFEIYTTTNGGTTWTKVPKVNIDGGNNALTNEYGTTNNFDTFGDTCYFGTTKGRVFKSVDKGLTWSASQAYLGVLGSNASTNVKFKNGREGIAIINDNQSPNVVHILKTTNAGTTWNEVMISGNFLNTSHISYIPQADAWMNVSADTTTFAGSSISFNDCNTFTGIDISKNPIVQYTFVKFYDKNTGWAGGFNKSPAEGGIFKWVGHIPGVEFAANGTYLIPNEAVNFFNLSDIENATSYYWQFEGANPSTSNDANPTNIMYPNAGSFDVSLTVTTATKNIYYNKKDYINVGNKISTNNNKINFSIFPNPVKENIYIVGEANIYSVKIYNLLGDLILETMPNNNSTMINSSELPNGIYFININTEKGLFTSKFTKSK